MLDEAHRIFVAIEQIKASVKGAANGCNHDRIKMKLKGLRPVQYRTQPLPA